VWASPPSFVHYAVSAFLGVADLVRREGANRAWRTSREAGWATVHFQPLMPRGVFAPAPTIGIQVLARVLREADAHWLRSPRILALPYQQTLPLGCGAMPNLTSLDVHVNAKLSQADHLQLASFIRGAPGLAVIRLRQTPECVCEAIGSCSGLRELDIADAEVTDSQLRVLCDGLVHSGSSSTLQRLNMAAPSVSTLDPLRVLSAALIDLTMFGANDITLEGFGHVIALQQLRRFDMSALSGNVSDAMLRVLSRLPHLERIDCSSSDLVGWGLGELAASRSLTSLRVNDEAKFFDAAFDRVDLTERRVSFILHNLGPLEHLLRELVWAEWLCPDDLPNVRRASFDLRHVKALATALPRLEHLEIECSLGALVDGPDDRRGHVDSVAGWFTATRAHFPTLHRFACREFEFRDGEDAVGAGARRLVRL